MQKPITNQPNFAANSFAPSPMAPIAPLPTPNQEDEIILKELTRHQILSTFPTAVMSPDPCCLWACAINNCSKANNSNQDENHHLTNDYVNEVVDNLDYSTCLSSAAEVCIVGTYAVAVIMGSLFSL